MRARWARIMRLHGPLSPELERQRELVERQAGNMARLLEDLLDVTRITQGTLVLKPERFDLSEAVTHAVEACRSLLEAREHTLQVSLGRGPLPIQADRLRVKQVVVNLLSNAAKYTERGGSLSLRLDAEGGEAVLSVADNGRGISPEGCRRFSTSSYRIAGVTTPKGDSGSD